MKDIVFDFGGVLVDWNPRHLYKKVFASAEEMEWFLGNVCTPAWNAQQDGGRSFAQAVSELKVEYPKYAAQIEDFYNRWDETLAGPIKGAVEILRELKSKGLRIYGLTNWSAETFPIAFERFDFFKLLDGIVVSGEEGLIKPDPEIYKRLLQRFDLQAPNCIFIDDNAGNIAAAKALGFEGIVFTTALELRQELTRRGIL